VPKADFTYEVRRGPQEPVAVEDYVVRTADGESAGTVGALLDRDGERLLVIDSGVPAIRGKHRVVPWSCVDRVDHAAIAVWLTLDAAELERTALELDPDQAVEEGEGAAEARRISEPPPDLIPEAQARISGPVEKTRWVGTLACLVATAFSALAAVIVISATGDNIWIVLFVVPALLALVTAALAYRQYRDPYEPRGARKP
jgi:hypothetical protein